VADPLRATEEAIRRGERSVGRAELAHLWGLHVNTVDRLPVPRLHVGGRVFFDWQDLHRHLTGKRRKAPAPDNSEAKRRLKRHGIGV
jgi:hypothetical protein